MELDDITGAIVDAAMQIHRTLGPGLLERGVPGALSDQPLDRMDLMEAYRWISAFLRDVLKE